MTRLGLTDNNMDYAVFVDQLGAAYPYSGQGSLESDTQPEPALNNNNDASVGKLALIRLDPGPVTTTRSPSCTKSATTSGRCR